MKAAAVILKWLGCTGKTGEEVFYTRGRGISPGAVFAPGGADVAGKARQGVGSGALDAY